MILKSSCEVNIGQAQAKDQTRNFLKGPYYSSSKFICRTAEVGIRTLQTFSLNNLPGLEPLGRMALDQSSFDWKLPFPRQVHAIAWLYEYAPTSMMLQGTCRNFQLRMTSQYLPGRCAANATSSACRPCETPKMARDKWFLSSVTQFDPTQRLRKADYQLSQLPEMLGEILSATAEAVVEG